jgi:hypothetical protein
VHACYLILERIAPNPMVTLNRAIALAEIDGPAAGLALLAGLDGDERMAGHHRLWSVRAHLLEKAGDTAGAREGIGGRPGPPPASPSGDTWRDGPRRCPGAGDRVRATSRPPPSRGRRPGRRRG